MRSSWDLSTLVHTAGRAFAQMSALGLLRRFFFFFLTQPSVLTGLMAKEQALANHIEMSPAKTCLGINLQNMSDFFFHLMVSFFFFILQKRMLYAARLVGFI